MWIRFGVIALMAAGVAGCTKPAPPQATAAPPHGRYLGVGIYRPELVWTKVVAGRTSSNPAAASPVDDQAVIVVTDSTTGEVRACGDLSGQCVGFNPWASPLAASQTAPVRLNVPAAASDEGAAAASSSPPAN